MATPQKIKQLKSTSQETNGIENDENIPNFAKNRLGFQYNQEDKSKHSLEDEELDSSNPLELTPSPTPAPHKNIVQSNWRKSTGAMMSLRGLTGLSVGLQLSQAMINNFEKPNDIIPNWEHGPVGLCKALREGRAACAIQEWGIFQGHIKYQINIEIKGSDDGSDSESRVSKIMLMRRYTEFEVLHKALCEGLQDNIKTFQLPPFPPKQSNECLSMCPTVGACYTNSTPPFIAKRKAALSTWIDGILKNHGHIVAIMKSTNNDVVKKYETSLQSFLFN